MDKAGSTVNFFHSIWLVRGTLEVVIHFCFDKFRFYVVYVFANKLQITTKRKKNYLRPVCHIQSVCVCVCVCVCEREAGRQASEKKGCCIKLC